MILADRDPAQIILYLTKDHNADAIVRGSRGHRDIKGLLMGSVSQKINHLTECARITVK